MFKYEISIVFFCYRYFVKFFFVFTLAIALEVSIFGGKNH